MTTHHDPTERPFDCAARGAGTKTVRDGLIDDEKQECTACGNACRWDVVDHPFFGFVNCCPYGRPPTTNLTP